MEEQGKSTIMVSVVMTTYNQKQYIQQALDSVLMQKTSFSYEILVGDDASTDGTTTIVKQYAQKYPGVIHAICREKNVGPTRNVYDLLCRAKGKYIANCEGDDYWIDCSKLQQQVDFLEENPSYSACTHDCQIVDENGCPMSTQKLKWVSSKTIFTQKDFKGIYLPGQPATWVHRNFMRDSNHDFSIIYRANPYVGDRTVTMILSIYGPIYHMGKVMSSYRKNNSHTANNVTTVVFAQNKNVNRMQYNMTCTLEEYAKEEFGISLRFTRFKVSQWIKMIIREIFRI